MKLFEFQNILCMKYIVKTIIAAGIISSVVSCGGKKNSGDDNLPVQEDAPLVSVQQVFVEDVPQTGIYSSTVMPFAKNSIAPQAALRIKKINVETGDFVKKDQVVAEMDAISLGQAELQMKNDSIEFVRLAGLYDAGGLSKSDLDAMELKYSVSRSNYENLLENTILRSPLDGVITARNYDSGDLFNMSLPIYTVEQITPVKLLIGISEADYTKVHRGDAVEITADAFPGRTFTGKVGRIYPTIDPATHTFTVEVIVDNKDRVLRPGMYAKVNVQFGVNRSVVVPDAAIVKQVGSGERFVYVLNEDNTVTYVKVVPGRRMDSRYEILSGIGDGDIVVTQGQVRLKSGIKVSVEK